LLERSFQSRIDPVIAVFHSPVWLGKAVEAWMMVMMVVVCLFWIIGVPWLLRRGVTRWPILFRWLRWSIGMAMLIAAWCTLAFAYIWSGVNFLLSALALVWAADIGGYAFGRAFGGKLTGGRKLAPAISPGKTWEGALGGFICVLLVGAVWAWIELRGTLTFWTWPWLRSIYAFWWLGGPVGFLVGAAFFTAMSIVGDLFESMVKRAAGAKDSSQLLPGHGGVLDRIDALLPTLPLALFVTTLPVLAVMLLGKMQ
jgi:phosphatidate cytidylyltransferase